MPKVYFDERIAARYQTYWPELFQPEAIDPVVDFLAGLAGDGAALELGIGTGRIALPLSRRGVPVHGIELSPAMVARLRDQPGGDQIDVAAQIAVSHHYWMIDGELETMSSPHRYVWPAELDLMARLTGMKLAGRWSGWHHEPFTGESTSHISVWEKTP